MPEDAEGLESWLSGRIRARAARDDLEVARGTQLVGALVSLMRRHGVDPQRLRNEIGTEWVSRDQSQAIYGDSPFTGWRVLVPENWYAVQDLIENGRSWTATRFAISSRGLLRQGSGEWSLLPPQADLVVEMRLKHMSRQQDVLIGEALAYTGMLAMTGRYPQGRPIPEAHEGGTGSVWGRDGP
ncbi:hypothetical protein [Miltoncostaea oceani]|uniref:hypothetical protein n=1 Tax=Miltoncostaea oceani TaxID=2843216 RepID=UPI001C3D8986|nr:hypothetical protein [Miltoncostaea oceani]